MTAGNANEHVKTILVVDDEPVIRELCGKALKGYRVLQASSGDEAIRFFEQGDIDLILTDVRMPRMSGLSLLKRLKQMEPTLVVIIMTGYAEKEVILDALKEDADDFITKPINLLQLKTAVEKALIKKALKEEIASLRNMDRLKTNFLSLISHKFRTPLTVISLFTERLAAGYRVDHENPEFRQSAVMAHEEALYLERLVADLLVFSKMMEDGGGLRCEICDIETLISAVVSKTKRTIRKDGVVTRLEVESLPPMLLDREKIAFAIRQVVDNAYKFSGETGAVSIRAFRDGDTATIVVEDRGPGISAENLPKIFEKFYQVDDDNTGQVPGFGLGLFYTREFIKAHDGSINVDSTPGVGTTVTITLPVAEAPRNSLSS